ncbi:probable insulin-like peptide 1 [Anastrepha ludens]|uniref:probable insulin-like peptide 1 n=1 Tax=Anastrepha ludens TaxID=28586 RepID=UPI0023B0FD60|nr:probable insulin-like peptide 1 [Anastrepha ludens]
MMSLNLLKIYALLLISLASFQHSAGQQTVCGPALDSVLDTICENGFNTKFKKSMEWDHHGNNELEDELPFRFAASPFLANFHGGQVDTLAKTRRRREGVYDECCRKSCTYSELFSYCK